MKIVPVGLLAHALIAIALPTTPAQSCPPGISPFAYEERTNFIRTLLENIEAERRQVLTQNEFATLNKFCNVLDAILDKKDGFVSDHAINLYTKVQALLARVSVEAAPIAAPAASSINIEGSVLNDDPTLIN